MFPILFCNKNASLQTGSEQIGKERLVEEWTVSVPGDMDWQNVWFNPVLILRRFYKVSGNFSKIAIFPKL